MKTIKTFQGQVNDVTFDSREAMNKYISQCIENGIDITNTSSHTEVRYVSDEVAESIENANPLTSRNLERTTSSRIPKLDSFPEPYKTVEEYLIPELSENVFTGCSKNNAAHIKDTSIKLQNRLAYFSSNRKALADLGLIPSISEKLAEKYKFCSRRTHECDSIIKNNEERIKRLQAEINHLREASEKSTALNKAYFDYGTYCETLLESLSTGAAK